MQHGRHFCNGSSLKDQRVPVKALDLLWTFALHNGRGEARAVCNCEHSGGVVSSGATGDEMIRRSIGAKSQEVLTVAYTSTVCTITFQLRVCQFSFCALIVFFVSDLS